MQERSSRSLLDARRIAEASQRLDAVKKEISALNKKAGALRTVSNEVDPVAPILEKIALLIEPGVFVESLSLNAEEGIVSVSGFSETRERVLSLADALARSDFVRPNSLRSPIQNILKEKGVQFSFTFLLQ